MQNSDFLPELHFRKLHEADHGIFEQHLLTLDPVSRRARFGMATSDEFLRQYAQRCITLNAIIHGAFHGNILIGVAELRPFGAFLASEAEIAFSVLESWRNLGVGATLFSRMLRSARNRGFSRLYMTCFSSNAPMQALAAKFAAEIEIESEEGIARVEAAPRTIISILQEALDDATAYTQIALEWQRNALWRKSSRRNLTR